MTLVWIIAATLVVSLISLVGALTLAINKKVMERLLILFVGFSAGSLIGAAFLHLLPEAIEASPASAVFMNTLIGFTFFFILERYLHWRHCHSGKCDIHSFTYLNLIGDGVHNFIDGMVIAASFLVDLRLGLVTTMAIILHEIPQEIGDFGILIYGGFGARKALFYNFLCGLTAIAGALVGYFLNQYIKDFSYFLIPFTAGSFIYIASSDLIPELHKYKDARLANLSFVMFLLGIGLISAVRLLHLHS